MNEVNNDSLHNVINSNILETFYTEYDDWCRNLWDCEFYVKWLKKDEFFETIKTYDDWNKLQKDVGLINNYGRKVKSRNNSHKRKL